MSQAISELERSLELPDYGEREGAIGPGLPERALVEIGILGVVGAPREVKEVDQLLSEVLRTVEAVYVTGSNLVDSQVSLIADMATQTKVITITHLDDLVVKGVLLGVCADAYSMGQLAGEKAVRILKGGKPSSIPIESAKKTAVILNMKTAKKGQFQIPPDLMKTVTNIIE